MEDFIEWYSSLFYYETSFGVTFAALVSSLLLGLFVIFAYVELALFFGGGTGWVIFPFALLAGIWYRVFSNWKEEKEAQADKED